MRMKSILSLACAVFAATGSFAADWAGETADWMKFIPDETPLARIMMPSSHDAGMVEGYEDNIFPVPKLFKGLFLNQNLTVGQQLAAGSRNLDLRPWFVKKKLYTCHCTHVDKLKVTAGGTGMSFEQIFDETKAFLAANPTETVFFEFSKWSYGNDADMDAKTRAAVKALMDSEAYASMFYRWTGDAQSCPSVNAMPLGNVRGKVIAIWDDTEPAVAEGIWGESDGPAQPGCIATCANWSNTEDVEELVENQLTTWAMCRGCDPTEIAFSSSWHLAWQFDLLDLANTNRKLADMSNPLTRGFLAAGVAANGKAMFIGFDYVSADLCRQIIAYNFEGYVAPVTIDGAANPRPGAALTAKTDMEGATFVWTRGDITGKFETAPVSTAASYVPTTADYEHWLKVTARFGAFEIGSAQIWFSKLPVVYVDTDFGKPIVSKDVYEPAKLRIQGNAAFGEQYAGDAEVRGRGNTSWALYPQKPYKVKLGKKADLFGFGKNKHWVLVPSWCDDVMLRNWGASSLAKELGILGMDMTWVSVIANGEYNGVYMLAEQVRVGENRVNIANWESEAEDLADALYDAAKDACGWGADDKKALEKQMVEDLSWITSGVVIYKGHTLDLASYGIATNPDLSGGYLYEMDWYWDDPSRFKTRHGVSICISEPEYAKTDRSMMAAATKVWQDFEDAYRAPDGCTCDGRHYSELADVRSMAAYWLLMETFANGDGYARSRYSYVDRGGKLTFGPAWDFDASSGTPVSAMFGPWALPQHWTVATMPDLIVAPGDNFFSEWLDDPYFCLLAYELYWSKVRPWMKAFLAEGGPAEAKEIYLAEARKANDRKFFGPGDVLPDDWVFRRFLTARLDWLDAQFADLESLMRSVRTPLSACPYAKGDDTLAVNLLNGIRAKTVCSTDFTVANGADADFDVQLGGARLLRNAIASVEVSVNGAKIGDFAVNDGWVQFSVPSARLVPFAAGRVLVTLIAHNANGAVVARNYATVHIGAVETDPYVADGILRPLPTAPEGFDSALWTELQKRIASIGIGIDRIWEVAEWIRAKRLSDIRLFASKYLRASLDLNVDLITDETRLTFSDVTRDASGGFSFRIRVKRSAQDDGEVVAAAVDRIAPYVRVSDAPAAEGQPIATSRLSVDSAGKVTVAPDPEKTGEFIRIVCPCD